MKKTHGSNRGPASSAFLTSTATLALGLSLLGSGCGIMRGGDSDPFRVSDTELAQNAEAWNEQHLHVLSEHRKSPSEPYWPHRLAELELVTGDVAEAETWFRTALEIDPIYAPAATRLSALLYEQARHFEAIDLLGPLSQVSRREEIRAALALHQIAVGEIEAAEDTVRPLEDTGDHWARIGSVLTYVKLQGAEFAHAPRLAERALSAQDTAANRNNFGIALLQEGKPEQARTEFEKALEVDPKMAGAHYNLAIVEKYYFFDHDAALEHYQAYRTLSSEDPDGLTEVFEGTSGETMMGAK